jgi:hypothetical protein
MNRKIRLLLSTIGLACMANTVDAQLNVPLFSLTHDTICRESEFVPNLLATGARTYNWTFCSPLLHLEPQRTDMGQGDFLLNTNNNLHTVKSDSFFYSFTANDQGRVFRYQYHNGMEAAPQVTDFGHFQFKTPANPFGTYAIETSTGWHVFVIGNSAGVGRLVRLDFADGLNYPLTGFFTYDMSAALSDPRELYMAVVNDSLRAFTIDNNELKRIDFSADINSIAHVENIGAMGGVFDGASGLAPIIELDNYHFIITNETSNELTHVTFGNSLLNNPFAVNHGDFSGKLDKPSGVTVIRDCNDYYGFVTNKDNAQWIVLHWNASIAGVPDIDVQDLGADLLLPTTVSNAVRHEGSVFMHVVNSSNNLMRIKYASCTNASIGGSDKPTPDPVKYNQNGTYSVKLVIDEGLPTEAFFCLPITVKEYPSINLTVQDTLICSGDTINMHALTFGTDSIFWSPDYNITPLVGNFVKVWPEYDQVYTVRFDFAPNCIVEKEFNIKVDKVVADAGRDRTITDGSATIIGGPNTTLRDHYTYQWTPTVFFETPTDQPVATVRPAQNMTYYLTVTSSSGCKAIDSVWVGAPCEDIRLPNAFVAGETTFGLLNLQLTQMNYFRIYDRWGKEVFSTNNTTVHWNGRNKTGIECEVGVYVWEIDAYCKDTNQRFRKTGNVTLLR